MNNNKQQTAVDIAFEKLANQGLLVTRDYKNLVVYREAKELEKQQTMDTFVEGMSCQIFDPNKGRAEIYYNETFNTKKP
jgi:hypothetical protein